MRQPWVIFRFGYGSERGAVSNVRCKRMKLKFTNRNKFGQASVGRWVITDCAHFTGYAIHTYQREPSDLAVVSFHLVSVQRIEEIEK